MTDERAPDVAAPEAAPEAPPPPTHRELELERELASQREKRAELEGTLRALAPPPQQGGGQMPLVRLSREQAQHVAASLGGEWNEEAVQQHAPVFAAFLQVLAAPLLQGIEGMADVVDLVQTRQEVTDYPTIAEEAEAVRRDYRARGQVLTRKAAVALVKSRRAEDPAYLDRLVDERARNRTETRDRQAAQAAAVVTEGGGPAPQKAGPDPTKGPRTPVTREQFARLPLEEKRKLLEGVAL